MRAGRAARGVRTVVRANEEQAMLTGGMLIGSAVTLGVWAGRHPLAVLNAAARRPTFVGRFDIAYGAGPRRALDIYLPADRCAPTAGGGLPIVVFFYGGSWRRGRRGDYRFVGEALASRGCVVAIPDYRLYPDAVFPDFVEDAAAAVRWACDHAAELGADPRRVYVTGHSAGAQIATLLATDGRFLRAHGLDKRDLAGVVGLAGPYDFLPLNDATLERIFPEPVRDASQPIRFVDGSEPPMLLASGLRDATVKPGNTARFAARVAAAGGAVQVRLYPGIGHALLVGAFGLPLRRFLPVLDDVAAFVRGAPRART
ncbi:alpha/beta hydrolase [Burkholderia thailandensis]|nr:alpha/beta hydrolase [Burkholderia thailandensis]KVG07707.1 carboxylesterase [Burkholderia thailandensis]MBS2131455.1 alpha/beta hydrolase [Burkholderia thailandensis]MCS3400397.1 alpha/beta hydrolase [Burkholderia thailandensis]MCS6478144.1 alpha/beta hydrolase [Burkholderia thailandensis]MCS6498145.1 alpha/beta hydrolase [Burkholderia thailandensis]